MASRASPLPDNLDPDELGKQLFDAVCVPGVMLGHCLITREQNGLIEIIYVGPLKHAPDVRGTKVYLNNVDFERLQGIVQKSRH